MKKRMYVYWGMVGVMVSFFVVCLDLLLGRNDFISDACKSGLVDIDKVRNFECIDWTIYISLGVLLIVIFILVGLIRNAKNKR